MVHKKNGRVDWVKTFDNLPPDLTIADLADVTGVSYQAAYHAGMNYGYKFAKRGYSKRKVFRPERDMPEYTMLKTNGVNTMDAIKAVQSQIRGREGAIEKAQRMIDAGHPPGVAAMYTGLTRAEVCMIIEEAAQ